MTESAFTNLHSITKGQRMWKAIWKGWNTGSLSQPFVTALWQIHDPELDAQRTHCLSLYGIAFAIFCVGCLFAFQRIGFAVGIWILAFILWTIASGKAEAIEEQLEQHKTEAAENGD